MEIEDKDKLGTVFFNQDIKSAIVPIMLREVRGDQVRTMVLGSAFFISKAGLFLTAKHVFQGFESLHPKHFSLLLLKKPHFKRVPLIALAKHPEVDAAIGMVDFGEKEGWRPNAFALSEKPLKANAEVFSSGYSRTTQSQKKGGFQVKLQPRVYTGVVIDPPSEALNLTKTIYSIDLIAECGLSGAPVIDFKESKIRGIIRSSFEGTTVTLATDIRALLDWPISFVGDEWNTIRGIAKNRSDLIALTE